MLDPKEVLLTPYNGDCPRDRVSLLAEFPHMHKILPKLVDLGDYDDYPSLWNRIIDDQIGFDFIGWGWVLQNGDVWSCRWAGHERLLDLMNVDILEAENAGWLRVTKGLGEAQPKGYSCKKLSPKQKAFARRNAVVLYEMGEDEEPIQTKQIRDYEK